jgi:hypothetical protein
VKPGAYDPDAWRRPNGHDHLQQTLLTWLCGQPSTAAWAEIELYKCRPDAYAVDTRRNKLTDPRIFEVKARREDFVGELRSEKWRKYLPYCTRFDFVTTPDICSKDEIPAEAGWLVLEDGNFKRRKRAQVRKAEVPDWFLMKVALWRAPNMPIGRAWQERQWLRHIEMKTQLGRAVAEILRDRVKARADVLRLQAEAKELEARILRLQAAELVPDYATSDLFEPPEEVTNG